MLWIVPSESQSKKIFGVWGNSYVCNTLPPDDANWNELD